MSCCRNMERFTEVSPITVYLELLSHHKGEVIKHPKSLFWSVHEDPSIRSPAVPTWHVTVLVYGMKTVEGTKSWVKVTWTYVAAARLAAQERLKLLIIQINNRAWSSCTLSSTVFAVIRDLLGTRFWCRHCHQVILQPKITFMVGPWFPPTHLSTYRCANVLLFESHRLNQLTLENQYSDHFKKHTKLWIKLLEF